MYFYFLIRDNNNFQIYCSENNIKKNGFTRINEEVLKKIEEYILPDYSYSIEIIPNVELEKYDEITLENFSKVFRKKKDENEDEKKITDLIQQTALLKIDSMKTKNINSNLLNEIAKLKIELMRMKGAK